MAKANFVAKARKAIPSAGIKKGDSYYWWKFRYGGKRVSKTPPTRSQLTQSDFLSQLYDIEDRISALSADQFVDDPDGLESELDSIADDIRALGDEQEDKLGNMPDSLQQSPTGEMLQNRKDECDAWADEIESARDGIELPERDDVESEVRGEMEDDLKTGEEIDANELLSKTEERFGSVTVRR